VCHLTPLHHPHGFARRWYVDKNANAVTGLQVLESCIAWTESTDAGDCQAFAKMWRKHLDRIEEL
jgi:hypothetical protein